MMKKGRWLWVIFTVLVLALAGAGLFFKVTAGAGKGPGDHGEEYQWETRAQEKERPADRSQEETAPEAEHRAGTSPVFIEYEHNYYALDLRGRQASLIRAERPLIPEAVPYGGKSYPITEIDDYALALIYMNPIYGYINPYGIEGVAEIPDTVTRIGDYAFQGQINMTGIQIPASVREIGMGAFAGSGLRDVEIPESVERIGGGAFLDTPWAVKSSEDILVWKGTLVQCLGGFSHTDYEIPNGVERVGEMAFEGQDIGTLRIPDHVTEIGAFAFAGCGNLRDIRFSDQVETMGGQAFAFTAWAQEQETEALIWNGQFVQLNTSPQLDRRRDSYKVPDGVTSISDYAFASCERLGIGGVSIDEIELPDSVQEIGKGAFWGCIGNVKMTGSVKTIGDYAFFRAFRNLRNNGYTAVSSVRIPEGVERIGKRAFGECFEVASVQLPSTISDISPEAFSRFPDFSGYSWTLAARCLTLNGVKMETAESYEAAWDQIFVEHFDEFPNELELLVPSGKETDYEKLFANRYENDVTLVIRGY